jgi:hypothetical protein
MQTQLYIIDLAKIDKGIRPAVEILLQYGFKTFESCEGGNGHAFDLPTIKFWGDEFDCIRAYELCEQLGLNVFKVMRVFQKDTIYDDATLKALGKNWGEPHNEIVFIKHSQTGTIFLPH